MNAEASDDRTEPKERRHALIAALGVALASLALNFATLSQGVHWYDSAEFAAKAIHLDIPHPPGYPLYIIVAHLFTRLPFEPAYSVNVLSAVCAALAAFFLSRAASEFGARPLAAASGALLLCVSFTFWDNTNIAESYGPGLAFAAATFWLLLRALRQQRPELAGLAALVAGVGTGAHLAIATLGLGFVALVWFAGGQSPEERVRTMVRCGIGAAVAMAGVYLLIPLSQPDRLGNADHWRWSWMMMSGGTFWNYFDLPTPEYPALRAARMIAGDVSVFGAVLAAIGMLWLARSRPAVALAFALAVAGNVGFFLEFEAHDLEVFFLPSVLVVCLLSAAGVEAIARATAALAESRLPTLQTRLGHVAAALCLLVPLSVAAKNAPLVDKSDDTEARDFGLHLVDTLPQHSVLLTFNTPDEWRLQSVWLYFQHGLGERPDVVPLAGPPLATVLCYLDAGHDVFAYKRHPDLVRTQFLLEDVPGTPIVRVRRSPAQGGISAPVGYQPGGAPPVCR